MKRTFALIVIAATGALLLAGCGGGDEASDADQDAITALVTEVNRITQAKDAEGFCEVIQPSGMKATFKSRSRCVRETEAILKQAGKQPTLEIDSIEVDGDTAQVKFKGRNGDASLVREDGKWYIPLESQQAASAAGDAGADSEPTDSGDGN